MQSPNKGDTSVSCYIHLSGSLQTGVTIVHHAMYKFPAQFRLNKYMIPINKQQ